MDIGKMINQRRTELKLTLEQVGQAVGVGKSTVKKWEDGYISNMRRDKMITSTSNARIKRLVNLKKKKTKQSHFHKQMYLCDRYMTAFRQGSE